MEHFNERKELNLMENESEAWKLYQQLGYYSQAFLCRKMRVSLSEGLRLMNYCEERIKDGF